MLRRETGLNDLTREEVFSKTGKLYIHSFCHQLWKSPQINWDGSLLGCCYIYDDDFGVNVFETGLEKAINSKNYRYAKQMLTGKAGAPQNANNLPCIHCDIYRTMVETGEYL